MEANAFQNEEVFLQSKLSQYRSDGAYTFGSYDGDIEELLKHAIHSKEKSHKRYSKTGNIIILSDYLGRRKLFWVRKGEAGVKGRLELSTAGVSSKCMQVENFKGKF